MADQFYTYMHTRNDTGQPFYIGKGTLKRARAKDGRNSHWTHISEKHGHSVHVLAAWGKESEAFMHERFLISSLRDIGVALVNKSDGGEGASGAIRTKENREKISASLLGRCLAETTKQKMSISRKGQQKTDAHKAAIRASLVGRKRPPELSEKLSAARVGKPWSEARRMAQNARKTHSHG